MSELLGSTINGDKTENNQRGEIQEVRLKRTPLLELQIFCQRHKLTPRESEIVEVLCQGVTRIKDIADQLRLSPNTVNNHVNSMFVKTKARSKSQLLSMLLGHFSESLRWACFFRRAPKVLLVIPDMDFSVRLHSVLLDFGFRVEIVGSQEECQRRLKEFPVNFIVAELSSGSVDATEILRVARATGSAQVLFIGGSSVIRTRCQAMDLGAIDLVKVCYVSDHEAPFRQIAETLLAHYMENESDRTRFFADVLPVKHSCRKELAVHPRNMGQGGVFLSLQELRELFGDQVAEGDVVELKLIKGNDELPAWAKGQVVWLYGEDTTEGPPGAGVRLLHFTKTSDESEAELRNSWNSFVQKNRISNYIPRGSIHTGDGSMPASLSS